MVGDKEYSGSVQSPTISSRLSLCHPLSGSKVKSNVESEVSSIGKSLLPSPPKSLWPKLLDCLDPTTLNFQEAKQRATTSGKTIPLWKELDLNSERNQSDNEETNSDLTQKPIGTKSGETLNLATLWPSPHLLELNLTGPSGQLRQTMLSLERWNDVVRCIGVLQLVESRTVPGKKPVLKLIANLHDPSFGMVIKVKKMLLLMNFEELLMSGTSSPGLTSIHYVLKSKVPQCHFAPRITGSVLTWNQETGSPTLITSHSQHSSED